MASVLDARFRLTTPLFNGGADPQAAAELRLPSFKGVLRFWWRALAWSRCEGDLARIQRQEDLLFGSTSSGQARVTMRLGAHQPAESLRPNTVLSVAKGNRRVVGMGARYLGYGLMAAFTSRSAIAAPFEFVLQIRASRLDDDLQDSLLQALIALGCIGGMGSRSRKGYGSLVLQSLSVDGTSCWSAPTNTDALCDRITALQGPSNRRGLPEFTAFSSGARHLVLRSEDCREPLELLDRIGREMVRYRSWGKGRLILQNISSERNFTHDHDLMKNPVRARDAHPARIAFGLPHNYGKGKDNEVSPDGVLDRRASPLFIHIHQCGSSPVAVLSFLPARFLPAFTNGRPAVISVGGAKVPQKPEAELYRPIHTFLDRLLDDRLCQERFTTVQEVGR